MYSNIKNKIKYILTISILLIFFIINIQVAEAKVDNLRISVGYEGGPFYTKADFSFEDLRSGMSDHVYGFSHIKGNGALNYNFARGYTLEYLLNQMADIYIDSIKRAVIVTTDEYLVNNKDITREYLFRENRYFYPELYRYYGTPDENKGRDRAEIVKPFIAVESNTIDFDISTDKDSVGELIEESLAGEGLSDNTSFRLLLGANPDLKTNTARNTAQDIYEIKLVLEGAPTLEIQEEAIIRDSEIGGNVINEDGTLNIQNGDIIDVDNLFDWKVEDVNYDDDEIRYNIEMAAKEQVEKAITNVYGKDAKPKFHTDFNIDAVEVLDDGRIRVKDASKLNLNTMYRSDYGFEHTEDGSGIRKDILNIKKDGKVGSEIFRNNSEVGTDEIVQGDSKYIYRGSNPPPNSVTPDPEEPNPDSNNNESENNKPDSEKPGNDKPGSDKPGNDKPGNNKPDNEKPGNEKPSNEKPGNEKPGNNKPDNEKPGNEKPGNEKPGNEKPGNEKPGNDKPGNEKPGNDKPGNEKPGNDKPGNEKPGNNKPGNEKPGNEKPGNEKPGNNKPDNEKPGNEKPGNDKPDDEKPGNEKPGNNKPDNEKPGNDKPGNDKPGNDKPGNDKPGNEKPGNNKPDNEKPGNNKPGNDKPGDEKPGDEETHNPKEKNPQQEGSIDEWDMDYDNSIGNIIALLDDSDSSNRKGIKIKDKAKAKSDINEIKKEISKKSDNLSPKKKDPKNDDLKRIANEVKKKSIDKPKKDIEYDIPKENIEIKDFGKNKTVYEMDPDVVKLGNVYQKNELMPHVLFMSILGFVFGIWLARWRFYNSL